MQMIRLINLSLELFGALLSLVIACSLLIIRNTEKDRCHTLFLAILVCNCFLLLSDAAAWGFKGQLDSCSRVIVPLANFFVFTLGYVLMLLYSCYLYTYLKKKATISSRLLSMIFLLVTAAVLLVIVSLFNGMYYFIDADNWYHRGDFFWLSQVLAILCMLANGWFLLCYRKYMTKIEFFSLSMQIVLPIIAMAIQIYLYGIALLYIATTVSTLIVYLNIQAQIANRMQEKELALLNSQLHNMLAVIQPHFLCNSLTAISQFCEADPKKAQLGIHVMASYLRENVNALVHEEKIPFSQEKRHIELYLSLQKLRFEHLITVVYDIETDAFLIPSLLLQPLVENAVCHGILKKESGGTVLLRVRRLSTEIMIQVCDDGAGFDTARLNTIGKEHIGIRNVEERCRLLCKGRMEIQSKPCKGTAVTLYLSRDCCMPEETQQESFV